MIGREEVHVSRFLGRSGLLEFMSKHGQCECSFESAVPGCYVGKTKIYEQGKNCDTFSTTKIMDFHLLRS